MKYDIKRNSINLTLTKGAYRRLNKIKSSAKANHKRTTIKIITLIACSLMSIIFGLYAQKNLFNDYFIVFIILPWLSLIMGILIVMKPQLAKYLSLLFVISLGLSIGYYSFFEEFVVLFQSTLLYIATLSVAWLLFALKVFERIMPLLKWLLIITVGLIIYLLFHLLLTKLGLITGNAFSVNTFYEKTLFVLTTIAMSALPLLDFRVINDNLSNNAPKVFEWYAGFSLYANIVILAILSGFGNTFIGIW